MYAFKCGDDSRNKLKGIPKNQPKNIKFAEYKFFSKGMEYQKDCENFISRSVNQEYLKEIKKSTLSIFDDKRCCLKNIEGIPWN